MRSWPDVDGMIRAAAIRRANLSGPWAIGHTACAPASSKSTVIGRPSEIAVAKPTLADAASLRVTYEREAPDAIERIEVVARRTPLEDKLEAEIAAARERLRCPNCGAPRKNNDACANCGREFVEPGP